MNIPKAREMLRRVVETHKLPKFIGKEPKEKVFMSGDKQKMEEKKKKVIVLLMAPLLTDKLLLQAMNILVSDAGEDAAKEEHLILEVYIYIYIYTIMSNTLFIIN